MAARQNDTQSCSLEFNPLKPAPKWLRQVILLGLILGNNPRAAKKDGLSLPSGKDAQAECPLPSAPLPSPLLPSRHSLPDTGPSTNSSSKSKHRQQKNACESPTPSLVVHIHDLISPPN